MHPHCFGRHVRLDSHVVETGSVRAIVIAGVIAKKNKHIRVLFLSSKQRGFEDGMALNDEEVVD